MSTATFGQVHGNIVTLDGSIAELEGRRVRVVLEPTEDSTDRLTADENLQLWREWSERGPQGPIDDAGFPDDP